MRKALNDDVVVAMDGFHFNHGYPEFLVLVNVTDVGFAWQPSTYVGETAQRLLSMFKTEIERWSQVEQLNAR